jgi:hypothetical protein
VVVNLIYCVSSFSLRRVKYTLLLSCCFPGLDQNWRSVSLFPHQ